MNGEVAALGELRRTFRTEVWFLTSVGSFVCREIAPGDESLLAFVAREWLLAAVNAFMHIEVPGCRKLRWTFRTEVGFLAGVSSHVPDEMVGPNESFSTICARERPITAVNAFVRLEAPGLGKLRRTFRTEVWFLRTLTSSEWWRQDRREAVTRTDRC